jgi:hypothetical protein
MRIKRKDTKLISLFKTGLLGFLSVLIMLPMESRGDYYVVNGPADDSYSTSECCTRVHHHRVIKHHYRPQKVHRVRHHCRHHRSYTHHRRSSYSMTVYYPVPAYSWAPPPQPCCCNQQRQRQGFNTQQASYPGVYFMNPSDRIVGNSINYNDDYGPAIDGGTADNDVY